LHIINFNNLCFRVENETALIPAKNRVDLSSISEVRSYITEWPRFFGATLYIELSVTRTTDGAGNRTTLWLTHKKHE